MLLHYEPVVNGLTATFLEFSAVILPSPHHRWSVSNSSVAQVDSMMGLTKALDLGVATVVVEDTRVVGHVQVSSLNVVVPDSLSLYIASFSTSGDSLEGVKTIPSVARWYVVSGRQYLIQMKVFSRGPDAQEIYITEVIYSYFGFNFLVLLEVLE